MKELRFQRFWFSAGCALVLLVIVACLLPAPTIAPVARLLPDKIEHAGAYFSLCLWFSALYPRSAWWKLALALCVLGGAVEIAQGVFTTTREADIKDEFANCIGVAIGLIVAALGGRQWARTAERAIGSVFR